MRQFYQMLPIHHALRDESKAEGRRSAPVSGTVIRHAAGDELPGLRPELSWTHYRLLLGVEDRAAPEQFIRDPYVLEFLDLRDYPALRESKVEQAIIDNLQTFLLELGKGFAFVARQRRMRFEDLPVANLERSRRFYEIVLEPLGYKFLMQDSRAIGFGIENWNFGIVETQPPFPPIHLAFSASTVDQVVRFFEAALRAGARSNGAPGLRKQYHAGYYAAFVLDPDGHNIEAVFRGS